jgi:hypothetical protein
MVKPPRWGDVPSDGLLHAHFYTAHLQSIRSFSGQYKTVVPLRHPVAVALSWWIRRPNLVKGVKEEWENMRRALWGRDVFFFPLETKPFDALQAYLGWGVCRIQSREGSRGDYEARDYWEAGDIDKLLKTKARQAYKIGMDILDRCELAQHFYGTWQQEKTQSTVSA